MSSLVNLFCRFYKKTDAKHRIDCWKGWNSSTQSFPLIQRFPCTRRVPLPRACSSDFPANFFLVKIQSRLGPITCVKSSSATVTDLTCGLKSVEEVQAPPWWTIGDILVQCEPRILTKSSEKLEKTRKSSRFVRVQRKVSPPRLARASKSHSSGVKICFLVHLLCGLT